MKPKTSIGIYCIGIVLLVNLVQIICTEDIRRHETESSNYIHAPEGENRILSRKRRFLKFPEGSSFQVVYDQTIPVVGSTLLFTVGITVAMAWQLPSVSILEIQKMLQEKNAQGSLRREDENINSTTLVDTSTSNNELHSKHSYNYDNFGGKYPTSYNKNLLYQQSSGPVDYSNRINYYTKGNVNSNYSNWPNPISKTEYSLDNLLFLSPYNWTRNDWSNLVTRYLQTWVRRYPPNYHKSKKRFYPVFGKRSIDDHSQPEEKFFLNHHRKTRHDLYLQIERFLEAKGKHGHHCVLRALCESGQRRHHTEPEPFLREILKAVFSIPSTHEASASHKHRMYDEAHSHSGDCAEKFPFCKDSIWSEDFIF